MVTSVDLDLVGIEVEEQLMGVGIQKQARAQRYLYMIKVEFYIVITSWNKDLKLQKAKKKATEGIRV